MGSLQLARIQETLQDGCHTVDFFLEALKQFRCGRQIAGCRLVFQILTVLLGGCAMEETHGTLQGVRQPLSFAGVAGFFVAASAAGSDRKNTANKTAKNLMVKYAAAVRKASQAIAQGESRFSPQLL